MKKKESITAILIVQVFKKMFLKRYLITNYEIFILLNVFIKYFVYTYRHINFNVLF